jgi:outer membrane protein OmpA-like peptidoglycan-associated protein
VLRPVAAIALLFLVLSVPARAQDWVLDGAASRLHMQTIKANAVIETHRFTGLAGRVDEAGNASVEIDLVSVATGIDVRDVRMRFLLFEAYKFPLAEVKAKVDMKAFAGLPPTGRLAYPLAFTLAMHGVSKEMQAEVTVQRIGERQVSVATAQPIIVTAEPFGLTAGIAKLSETVGGTAIVPAVSITFDLVFATGERVPEIVAEQVASTAARSLAEAAPISAEACETRFSVISTAQAIYFKTGSAELDEASAPMLNSVADIAGRCPAAKIEVTGHTDSVGSREKNRQLSESRARSVADYLAERGVARTRISARGFGDTRPVASNDSEANRAKNRRIEFKVVN